MGCDAQRSEVPRAVQGVGAREAPQQVRAREHARGRTSSSSPASPVLREERARRGADGRTR